MAKNIDIGGRLHSVASGNVVTGANEILDDAEGKKQNVINAELRQAIKDSQINEAEATVDEGVGTPSATAEVIGQKLSLAFQNIMGDGIASIEQTTTSQESEGINEVTVTTVGGKVGTFQIRNGKKGDTVILGEGVEYVLYNGLGQNTDGAMTQKAVTDAMAADNILIADLPYRNRLIEAYFTGLNSTHTYDFQYLKYYESGTYKVVQVHLRDKTTNTLVALAEKRTEIDYIGVIEVAERNSSGVNGYVFVNVKLTDTDSFTNTLNITKASVLEYSPLLSEYLYPHILKSQYDSDKEAINDKLVTLDTLNQLVSVTSLTGFGNYRKDGSSAFSYVTKTTIAGFQNMISSIDGIVKSISFRSKGASMKFGIGIIDQRNIAVIRKTFDVNCIADAQNTIELGNQSIKINQGETLFAIFSSDATSICFTSNSSTTADVQMVYSTEGRELHTHASPYGARLNLYWEIVKNDSPFALKEDVIKASEKADAANELASEALSNFGLVKDRQGNYYQLIVVNGAISIIPLIYQKVLVICNSIGFNGRVYANGWCGIRGMASSRNGLDYKTHLENGLKQKDANAVVVLRNVWNWENDFDSITPAQLMSGYLTSDIDCIIFRAGENIPTTRDDIAENVVDLMAYCISQCPNANIFVTSMVWEKGDINNDLLQAANELGVPFIDVLSTDSEYRERLGDYLEGDYTSDEGQTWDTSTKVLYKITGSGVASHTNDVGMLRIANNILSALKYDTLPLLHSISIGETNGYTCSLITNEWVEGGIVNVASDGNAVSVVDSSNNSIVVTDHNDGIFTFEMPNSDVVISVS